MDEMVTQSLRKQFEDAGWYENRCVDPAEAVAALHLEGYECPATVRSFLAEFDKLVFLSPIGASSMWLDGSRAARFVDREWTTAYEGLVDAQLVPVGGYDAMTIYADSQLSYYGGFDSEFGRLAENVDGLVQGLVNRNPLPRLDLRVPA